MKLFELWLRLPVKADIFGDSPLDITHRVHDVDITPIHAFFSLLLSSSCARHVHHALALARRHHRGMLAKADHVRRHGLVNQATLQFCFGLRGATLLNGDHLVLSYGLGGFVLFV